MNILDVSEQWVHTHIILDRADLSPEERSVIAGAIEPVLREHAIQAGYRIVEEPNRGISRVVLECVPLRRVQEHLREALARAIRPIPAKPVQRNTVTGIRVLDDADRKRSS